ncbi:MAG: SCO family protein [Verrucomicrobiota bacterium]|nr:SCO family protein [Verrucomicrobiota bacterium]
MNAASVPLRPRASVSAISWKAVVLGLPLVVATVFFFIWRGQVDQLSHRKLESLGTVPPFELINQHGQPFGSAELQGKIWIADFVFTSCKGPCPIISSRMSELQRPLEKSDVHLVSFTVDPQTDTPAVLLDYSERLHARPGRWDFLTGPAETIYRLTRDGFKLAISDGADELGVPVHSTRAVLVDRRGTIRGYYDITAPDGVTTLLADASHLLREQPK